MKGDSNLATNIPTSATREGPDFDVIHGYLEQMSEKVIWFARSYNVVPDDESCLCLLTWLDWQPIYREDVIARTFKHAARNALRKWLSSRSGKPIQSKVEISSRMIKGGQPSARLRQT